jgi:hypothetical protein
MDRRSRGAPSRRDLVEELGDDRNDRDDGRGDPEQAQT